LRERERKRSERERGVRGREGKIGECIIAGNPY